jgi:hypothetical protein
MTDTHVLTALYPDHAAARRAAERLRGVGVSEGDIELHAAAEGDVRPGEHRAADGLFGALSTLLVPESDLRAYERGLGRGGAVLIARDVPEDRVGEAEAALDEDALEIDDDTVPGDDEDRGAGGTSAGDEDQGAIGTPGGFGRATGDVDRLTGKPIGHHARAYRPR